MSAPGDRPLSVVHLVTAETYSGIERHVIRLSTELRRAGCDATIACPPRAGRLRDDAAAGSIPCLPRPGTRTRTWLLDLARHLRAAPPDVLHIHDGKGALAAGLLMRDFRGTLARTQHFTRPATVERSGAQQRMSVALHRRLNRRLSAYIAVSESALDAARERGELTSAITAVIPPCIVLPSEGAVQAAGVRRQRLEHPVVAYVGRLEDEKELDVLVRAVPAVLLAVPTCRFVIAGSGAARDRLEALTRALGVDEVVDFVGEVAQSDEVLSQVHVYANPWPWEGFGLAMAEAMAYGVPVVAVDSGASPELVQHEVTGLLCPPGDPEAFGDALIRLTGDRALAITLGAAGARSASENYGAVQTAEQTLSLYRRRARSRPA